MSRNERYFARSQEGGAIMSMDELYSAKIKEGSDVMPRDGDEMNVHGTTAFRNDPGRRCDTLRQSY